MHIDTSDTACLSFKNAIKVLRWDIYPHEKERRSIEELDAFKEGLAEYAKKELVPLKTDLELQRIEYLEKLKRNLQWLGIAACGCVALSIAFPNPKVWMFSAFVLPLLYYFAIGPARRYRKKIKRTVFGSIIRFLGPDFSYGSLAGNLQGVINHFSIVPDNDIWETDDIIKGSYKDVDIKIEEATLQERYQQDGKERRRTVFKGMFIVLEMNKRFKGKTVVRKDKGGIVNWLRDSFSDLERCGLEDPKFEKVFEAYTTDQIEARYLLTTAFMDRIVNLERSFTDFGNNWPGSAIGDFQFAFHLNQLMIMIPCNRNLFEPHSIIEPALQTDEIINFLEEIYMIFEIIDFLKLHEETHI